MKQIEKDLDLPDWFNDLVDKIKDINVNAITDPITELYTGLEIEGWTIPPFQCLICGATFAVDDDTTADEASVNYATHLVSHLTAFRLGWFPTGDS